MKAALFARVVVLAAGIVFGGGGCADALSYGSCVDDAVCGAGTVCAFGVCVDANDPRLDVVDIEIEPVASSGLLTQSVFNIDAAAAPGDRVNVTMQGSVTLQGTVQTLAGDGVEAQVQARPAASIPGRLRLATTTTDADGAFSLSLLDNGRNYGLSVVPDDRDHPPQDIADVDPAEDLAPIVIDEEAVTAFVHLQGRIIAGAGVEAAGIPDLEVRVLVAGRRVSTLATTGRDGAFELTLRDTIPLGATLDVQPGADNAGFPSLSIALDVGAAGVVDLGDISLGEVVTAQVPVSGLVVDAAGVPVANAAIAVRGFIGAGTVARSATSAADGTFAMQLIPGGYTLAVIADGASRAGLLLEEITVQPVDIVKGGLQLTLTMGARENVAVQVTSADGVAMAGGSVSFQRVGDVLGIAEPVLDGAQPVFTTSADVEGHAALVVDEGRYRVSIQPPRDSGAPAFSTLVTVDGNFNRSFVLPAQSVLAGVVVDGAGAPAPGAFVRVFSQVTDEQGRAIFLGEAVCAPDGSFAVSVPDLTPTIAAVEE